jgi:HTH-type transcriptional regulator/antitoxin HigA
MLDIFFPTKNMMRVSGGINMNITKINNTLKTTITHWKHISRDIHEPLNRSDYDKLSKILDHLLDIVGENEKHELIGLVDFVSHMLTIYDERENYQIKNVSAIKALKFLMDQHQLNQSHFPEIGSQGVVSEILHGKRKLNLNQIQKLSKRFHVSPNTFIE